MKSITDESPLVEGADFSAMRSDYEHQYPFSRKKLPDEDRASRSLWNLHPVALEKTPKRMVNGRGVRSCRTSASDL